MPERVLRLIFCFFLYLYPYKEYLVNQSSFCSTGAHAYGYGEDTIDYHDSDMLCFQTTWSAAFPSQMRLFYK